MTAADRRGNDVSRSAARLEADVRCKMKRIIPIVLVVSAVSMSVLAQGGRRGAPPAPPSPLEPGASQADVDKALMPLPAALRDQATVIKWKSDFTYDTLRKGTNG